MKKTDKLLNLLLYVSLVVVGIVVGIVIRHFSKITVSEEVNILDMATLVVTVFLAVYVPAVLDRRLQSNQEKQDLLINRVNDFQSVLRRVNILVQSVEKLSANEHLTVKNLLDVSQHKIRTLISLMKSANIHGDFEKTMDDIVRMNDEHKALLYSEKMDEGNFSYSEEVKTKEEMMYNNLDEITSILIFNINDSK